MPADALRWPVVGRFLRWRHARAVCQLFLLIVAGVLVAHGLFGPRIAPANLATVVTWIHYRALLVGVLLAAGNFFCTGCPFILVRDWGRRLRAPSARWPRRLRNKWIGVGLFVAILFGYELFDLWSRPAATAWLVLGYFAVALAIDLVFRGATFCKFLCPIGQFSFVTSTMSPFELRVRNTEVCGRCRTIDCIKGRPAPTPGPIEQRGCELALFLPAKVGNLDCTMCLDCVQACPHDNIGLMARLPGQELGETGHRSGIGRLERRADIAALIVVFVFGGLVNAFGMVAPARAVERSLASALGVHSDAVTLLMIFGVGLVALPAILLGAAGAATVWLTGHRESVWRIAGRYVVSLVPLGCGIWVSHYGFHLLTGALTVVPVTQSAVLDLTGRALLGVPLWQITGMRPGAVFPFEVGAVLLGASGAIGLAFLVSERDHGARAFRVMLPWVLVVAALSGVALWILSQPMEMRGVSLPG